MKKTLIEPWQNPKGRKLVQEDDNLHVLSECCNYTIKSLHNGTGGHTWLQCVNCEAELQMNSEKLWNCYIERIGLASNAERWDEWARDIFGYTEEFVLVVSV